MPQSGQSGDSTPKPNPPNNRAVHHAEQCPHDRAPRETQKYVPITEPSLQKENRGPPRKRGPRVGTNRPVLGHSGGGGYFDRAPEYMHGPVHVARRDRAGVGALRCCRPPFSTAVRQGRGRGPRRRRRRRSGSCESRSSVALWSATSGGGTRGCGARGTFSGVQPFPTCGRY